MNVMMEMSTTLILYGLMDAHGINAISMLDSIADTLLLYQETIALRFAVMVVTMDLREDGTIGMLMNVMTVTEDQVMAVILYAESKKAGLAGEEALTEKMFAHQNVEIGGSSIESIVMMVIQSMEMVAHLLVSKNQALDVQEGIIIGKMTAMKSAEMVETQVTLHAMMETR
jgi:hypothetical protein